MVRTHTKKRCPARLPGMFLSVILVVVMLSLSCESVDPEKGYTSKDLYRSDVKTVFVQMFESRSFRRQIEFELSRAICQQMELHSPYKVVSDRRKADTILYGRIQKVSENVVTRQRDLDRPIQNEVTMTVIVTWKDLRSGEIMMDEQAFRTSVQYAVMLAAGSRSAEKVIANDTARKIVQAMEAPW